MAQLPPGAVAAACDRAMVALAAHPRGPAYGATLAEVRGCGDRTAEALAAEWRRRPTEPVEIEALSGHSNAVMDRRVAVAAHAVLADVGATRPQRLAALHALMGQVSPALSVSYVDTSAAGAPGVRTAMLGQRADMARPTRRQPSVLAPDALIGMLNGISSADPDPVLRRAATDMARDLTHLYGAP